MSIKDSIVSYEIPHNMLFLQNIYLNLIQGYCFELRLLFYKKITILAGIYNYSVFQDRGCIIANLSPPRPIQTHAYTLYSNAETIELLSKYFDVSTRLHMPYMRITCYTRDMHYLSFLNCNSSQPLKDSVSFTQSSMFDYIKLKIVVYRYTKVGKCMERIYSKNIVQGGGVAE